MSEINCKCKGEKCGQWCGFRNPKRKNTMGMPDNKRKEPTYQKRVLTVCGRKISYFTCCDERVMFTIGVPLRDL